MTFTTLHPKFRTWPSVQVALSFLSTDRIKVVPLSVGGWVDQLGKVSISEVDEYLNRLLNLYIPEYADSEYSLDRLKQTDIFAELSRLVPAAWPVSSVERAWSQGRVEQAQVDMRQKYQSLSERVDRLLHQSASPVILSPPAPTPI